LPGPGDVTDNALRASAAEAVRQLPAGKVVVVANCTRAGGPGTQLGMELSKRFSIVLFQESRRAGGRIKVIDRRAGAQALGEEMRYVVDRMNPKELLDRFQADYAVVGEYELDRSVSCVRLDLRAVETMGATLEFVGCCNFGLGDEQFYEFEQKDKLPLSTASDSMTAFFVAEGEWDAVEITGLETRAGDRIPANGRVKVNAYYRPLVRVKEECNLYALGWDQTNGYLSVLYPGKGETARFGKGDFPVPGASWIQAIPPPGANLIKVIATRTELDGVKAGTNLIESSAAQNALVARIRSLGPGNWGSATFGYYIEE